MIPREQAAQDCARCFGKVDGFCTACVRRAELRLTSAVALDPEGSRGACRQTWSQEVCVFMGHTREDFDVVRPRC